MTYSPRAAYCGPRLRTHSAVCAGKTSDNGRVSIEQGISGEPYPAVVSPLIHDDDCRVQVLPRRIPEIRPMLREIADPLALSPVGEP